MTGATEKIQVALQHHARLPLRHHEAHVKVRLGRFHESGCQEFADMLGMAGGHSAWLWSAEADHPWKAVGIHDRLRVYTRVRQSHLSHFT